MIHTKSVNEVVVASSSDVSLLKLTVDAMMDSLTIDQRKKVAAYIIRNAKIHPFTYSQGTTGATENSLVY